MTRLQGPCLVVVAEGVIALAPALRRVIAKAAKVAAECSLLTLVALVQVPGKQKLGYILPELASLAYLSATGPFEE